MSKSVFIPIGEVQFIHIRAHFFGYGAYHLPPYLGLPLYAIYNSTAICELVVECFHKRVSRRKSMLLCKGID